MALPNTTTSSDPVDLQPLVDNLLSQRSANISPPNNPASTHRRRRIEWPSLNPSLVQIFRRAPPPRLPHPGVIAATKSMLDDEFAKCSYEGPLFGDGPPMVDYFQSRHGNDFGPL